MRTRTRRSFGWLSIPMRPICPFALPRESLDWRLISRLLLVQRFFGQKNTNRRKRSVYGHLNRAALLALPHLSHCPVLELRHLVQALHFPFHNLRTGDGFGHGPPRPTEQNLWRWSRVPVALKPRHGETQKVPDLASFLHTHFQHTGRQSWDWTWDWFPSGTDLPESFLLWFVRSCGIQFRGLDRCGLCVIMKLSARHKHIYRLFIGSWEGNIWYHLIIFPRTEFYYCIPT